MTEFTDWPGHHPSLALTGRLAAGQTWTRTLRTLELELELETKKTWQEGLDSDDHDSMMWARPRAGATAAGHRLSLVTVTVKSLARY